MFKKRIIAIQIRGYNLLFLEYNTRYKVTPIYKDTKLQGYNNTSRQENKDTRNRNKEN